MLRRHLQANNSEPFERALSETMDRSPDIDPGIKALRGFKFNPPDHIVPYLIVEYGLTEIEDYLPDPRTVLVEGILWQRLRGTPAALHRALSWIGHDGALEENPPARCKWWWFQVHLPFEVRSSAFARPMTALANASKPLRSEFARVTSGYDKRAFLLNGHRLNGGGLLNSWSGVRKDVDGPVLSLRHHHRASAELGIGDGAFQYASRLRHTYLVDAAASVSVWSSMSVSNAPVVIDTRVHVPFQNGAFLNRRFGEPSPRVQSGF
ncbi:phage tail protein [Ensifer adhaerens]|nr:phage tail protein [Ensifer adhaerens]